LALNQRGQAALTDALYFLLIVSALSTLLFFFAANYGQVVEQRVVNQYWREYATGALETILYSSTPRIPNESLEDATEIDYLLAAVKEDYADDGEIDETEEVLVQTISGIMQPFAANFDYVFYIYLSDEKEFAFVMIHTREDPKFYEDSKDKVKPGKSKVLFCEPKTLNDLEAMVESVGLSAQSSSRLQLVEVDSSDRTAYPVAQANLTMWVPTPIAMFIDGTSDGTLPGLNCKEYNPETYASSKGSGEPCKTCSTNT